MTKRVIYKFIILETKGIETNARYSDGGVVVVVCVFFTLAPNEEREIYNNCRFLRLSCHIPLYTQLIYMFMNIRKAKKKKRKGKKFSSYPSFIMSFCLIMSIWCAVCLQVSHLQRLLPYYLWRIHRNRVKYTYFLRHFFPFLYFYPLFCRRCCCCCCRCSSKDTETKNNL